MNISQRAFDFIVGQEVTSQAYYIRHYQNPEWPGGKSGITVAIGYDLGYATRDKIRADWGSLVSPDMLRVMQSCAGVTGDAARALLPAVKVAITIPWDAAISVFANRDMPHWTSAVRQALQNSDKLSSSCLGSLVSLAYNRGCSFALAGDRYSEMRAIKSHMGVRMLTAIPVDIRDMKRLWPSVKGLRNRRDAEAAMFEAGITATDPEAKVGTTPASPDPDVPLNEGAARTKPPATTMAQHGTAGSIIVAGGVATQQAHAHGFIGTPGLIFCGFLALLAAVSVWVLWYRNRNPK